MQLIDVQYSVKELLHRMKENYDYVKSSTHIMIYGRRLDCSCYAKTVYRRNVFVYYVKLDNETVIDEIESSYPLDSYEQFSFFCDAIKSNIDIIRNVILRESPPYIVENQKRNFDVALLEKEEEDGLSKDEIMILMSMLNEEVYPVEYFGRTNSSAMGFITKSGALRTVEGYDNDSSLGRFISSILSDMELENENKTYEHHGLLIYLSR